MYNIQGDKMNETIRIQLNRRSIRRYKDKEISKEILDTLVDVARSTPSANFTQQASLISITDTDLKASIAKICNQEYINTSAHLFIVVLDMYRNNRIACEENIDTEVLQSTDRFLSSMMDATLMAQNIVIAAESFGIGSVFLGSVANDAQAMIKLLDLPHSTFPILGIALGYSDDNADLKPRIPRELMHFENQYDIYDSYHESLKEYDETVKAYYSSRNNNQRVEAFTQQMASRMLVKHPVRMRLLEVLHEQGLIKY